MPQHKAIQQRRINNFDEAMYIRFHEKIVRFVELIEKGKTLRQAAIGCGLRRFANNPYFLIEQARTVYRLALDSRAPIGVQVKKIAEGMDATITKFFTYQGVVTDKRTVIDYPTRHKYLDLAARIQGLVDVPAEGDAQTPMAINVQIVALGQGPENLPSSSSQPALPPATTIEAEATEVKPAEDNDEPA